MAWVEKRDANGQIYYQADVGTTGDLSLGNAYAGAISSFYFQVNTNGSTVAITPKGRKAFAEAALAPLAALNYQKLDANPIDISGTAISADGNYIVRADGMAITLTLSTHSGGSGVIVYPSPLLG